MVDLYDLIFIFQHDPNPIHEQEFSPLVTTILPY